MNTDRLSPSFRLNVLWLGAIALVGTQAAAATLDAALHEDTAAATPLAARSDAPPLDNTGPWGIASGAEWAGEHPRFNPLLRDAGVRWLRYFPEWQTIQPRRDEWNWAPADRLVANARENGIQIAGVFLYFARWASADGGTRRGPIKDLQYWRDYVRATMSRYRNDIRHWAVWNEFNGSFYEGRTREERAQDYADLTVAAYEEAKKIDPGIQIGMGVANFDVGFFDAAIKAGAAGHFDFLTVHPYEFLGTVMSDGAEHGFLSLAGSLRRMLKDNAQRADMPLWITEVGVKAPIEPDAKEDARQAEALVKVYILSMAQGFERVCWFEARGPAYGRRKEKDHGLIRRDWTPRPAYVALQTLTRLLGAAPAYTGWLKLGEQGYGFVFANDGAPVLVAWSPPAGTERVTFADAVRIVDLTGEVSALAAGEVLELTRVPVLIADLPVALAEQARRQKDQPFPWGTDFSKVSVASCRLGGVNLDQGIRQVRPATTTVINDLTESWRRTNFAHGSEGRYAYFRVDPTFAGFGNRELEITVVARRVAPDKVAGMNLTYESLSGYRGEGSWFGIPAGEEWHEHTWKITDANFVGGWAWNFRTDASASPNEFDLREVRVRRLGE